MRILHKIQCAKYTNIKILTIKENEIMSQFEYTRTYRIETTNRSDNNDRWLAD